MKNFFKKTFNLLKKVYSFCFKKVDNVVDNTEDIVEDIKVVAKTTIKDIVEEIKTTILENNYNKFHYEYVTIKVSENEKIHHMPYDIDSS